MVPRERVLTALAHEEPDRVPTDLWMTPKVEAELIRLTGVEDPFAMRVEAGHDLLMSSVGMVSSFYMSQENEYVDPWGIRFARTSYSHGAGSYTEINCYRNTPRFTGKRHIPPGPDRRKWAQIRSL